MLTLGLLASHRGSNVQAVVEACRTGRLEARPGVIISNNAYSEVLQFAQSSGIPARRIGGPSFTDDEVRDAAIQSMRISMVTRIRLLNPSPVQKRPGSSTSVKWFSADHATASCVRHE